MDYLCDQCDECPAEIWFEPIGAVCYGCRDLYVKDMKENMDTNWGMEERINADNP